MLEGKKHLKLPHVAMIYAVSVNNVMGKDGDIPWYSPEDFAHFKDTTKGHSVVMGRKTWESLPKKPLPGRVNVVVTSQQDYHAEGAVIASSLYDAVTQARRARPEAMVFIIGGKALLEEAQYIASVIYVTTIGVHVPTIDCKDCVTGPSMTEEFSLNFTQAETKVLCAGKAEHPAAMMSVFK